MSFFSPHACICERAAEHQRVLAPTPQYTHSLLLLIDRTNLEKPSALVGIALLKIVNLISPSEINDDGTVKDC